MGRKKKNLPPAKKRIVNFRISEELYQAMSADALAAKLSLSEYLRKKLLGRSPTVHYEVVFNDLRILQIFRDLGRTGGNINQIAGHLNRGGVMNNQLWKELRNCVSEIYEMRDALKKYLGEYRGPVKAVSNCVSCDRRKV